MDETRLPSLGNYEAVRQGTEVEDVVDEVVDTSSSSQTCGDEEEYAGENTVEPEVLRCWRNGERDEETASDVSCEPTMSFV